MNEYMQKSMKAKDGERIDLKIKETTKSYKVDHRIPVCIDGQLAREYSQGKEKLVPILWSSGFFANGNNYSTICRDLASYGFIVFTCDHHGGSCAYTEKANGEEVLADFSLKYGHEP
jgi:hypothetical protein